MFSVACFFTVHEHWRRDWGIYEFVPADLLANFAGASNLWAVPLAAVLSIPMYIRTETMIPIIIDFGADSCIPCKEMAPVLVLVAGILTSVTPCALSGVPLVIGYVGGSGSSDTRRAFKLSLTFAGGMAVTFTALGTAASLPGKCSNLYHPHTLL